jgi:predicted ester cyclase
MASNGELARRYFEAVYETRNYRDLDDLCAPDCLFHHRVHGALNLNEFKDAQEDFDAIFPIIGSRLDDLIDAGDTQVLRFTVRATMEGAFAGFDPTGRSGDSSGIVICRFGNGKLVELWGGWNVFELLQNVGALYGQAEAPALERYSDATAPAYL